MGPVVAVHLLTDCYWDALALMIQQARRHHHVSPSSCAQSVSAVAVVNKEGRLIGVLNSSYLMGHIITAASYPAMVQSLFTGAIPIPSAQVWRSTLSSATHRADGHVPPARPAA